MEAAIWGFIGTMVGALASLGTTLVSTRNAFSLQSLTSSLDRAEKHREFQRSTLVELQDAIHDLLRIVTRGLLEDQAAFRKTGTWGENLLSDEVNDGQRLARRRVVILMERVADDALRADVKRLNEALTHASFNSTEADSELLIHAASNQALQVMEHIGTVLRAQY